MKLEDIINLDIQPGESRIVKFLPKGELMKRLDKVVPKLSLAAKILIAVYQGEDDCSSFPSELEQRAIRELDQADELIHYYRYQQSCEYPRMYLDTTPTTLDAIRRHVIRREL